MENIKEKIKKLLDLANNAGATEAEAERAMEMASAMMIKYNIQLDPETDELKMVSGPYVMQDCNDAWHHVIASTAAYLYNCKSMIGYGARFIGREINVDAATQTFIYLIQQVEQQYKLHLPKGLSKSDRADFRRTFKFACANRVYHRAEKIMQQFRNDDATAIEYTGSKALVVVASIDAQIKEAEAFMYKEFPNVKFVATRPRKMGSGTHAGFKAGDKVQLNRSLG